MLVNLQDSHPVLRTPFLELLVTLVIRHEYQKACSLVVPEQKLLPIHDHSLLHCVICVSGEAHTQDSCPYNQAAGENSTHVISQTALPGA